MIIPAALGSLQKITHIGICFNMNQAVPERSPGWADRSAEERYAVRG